MFCTNCGKKMSDDALFCPQCGANMQIDGENVPQGDEDNFPSEQRKDDSADSHSENTLNECSTVKQSSSSFRDLLNNKKSLGILAVVVVIFIILAVAAANPLNKAVHSQGGAQSSNYAQSGNHFYANKDPFPDVTTSKGVVEAYLRYLQNGQFNSALGYVSSEIKSDEPVPADSDVAKNMAKIKKYTVGSFTKGDSDEYTYPVHIEDTTGKYDVTMTVEREDDSSPWLITDVAGTVGTTRGICATGMLVPYGTYEYKCDVSWGSAVNKVYSVPNNEYKNFISLCKYDIKNKEKLEGIISEALKDWAYRDTEMTSPFDSEMLKPWGTTLSDDQLNASEFDSDPKVIDVKWNEKEGEIDFSFVSTIKTGYWDKNSESEYPYVEGPKVPFGTTEKPATGVVGSFGSDGQSMSVYSVQGITDPADGSIYGY